MSGGYFQFQAPQLRVIPIRVPGSKTHSQVVRTFNELSDRLHEGVSFNDPQVEDLRKRLDELILSIYDLTPEEKKLLHVT